MNRTITLQVSASYEVPELYTKAHDQDVEEALTMGAWIQATLKSKKSTEEVRKVTERKDAELLRIQTQYQERMAKLMDDMKALAAEKEALHLGVMDLSLIHI